MPANTIKGNDTGSTANVSDLAAVQIRAVLPGIAVQTVTHQTGSLATGTAPTPFDDTVPQSSEGTQFMSLSVTPTNAASMLLIDVVVSISSNIALSTPTAALFQDGGTSAIAAMSTLAAVATGIYTIAFRHSTAAGTTSSTTFKVRIGGTQSGETLTFNGTSGARNLGGVMASSITVTEYLP